MRDTTRLTRRRWLAACGGTAAVSLAGCLGGDSTGDGGGSGGSDGGSGADDGGDSGGSGGTTGGSGSQEETNEIQPRGQKVLSTQMDGVDSWTYDLEAGDTITVFMDANGRTTTVTASVELDGGVERLAKIDSLGDGAMQYTADTADTYEVSGSMSGGTIEVYVDRS